MDIEEIARDVVDSGYRVHTVLGPGLLEYVYEVVLAKLLADRGFGVERQKPIPITFEGLRFDEGFRADLMVEGKILVEIKSVENFIPVYGKQVLTYLKLLNLPLGLLINFGSPIFKSDIKRIVNNHSDFASSRALVSGSPERRRQRSVPLRASYIEAYGSGRLQDSIGRARRWMKKCTLCPRLCGVDRMADEKGYCRTGRMAVLASYGPHYGEERPLVGSGGSGTIFFSHCNLFCIFCQNYDISHGGEGTVAAPEDLAEIMLVLQRRGCHNINFVTPSHVILSILEALPFAVEKGLNIPLVYNCGGYERVPALKLLDGIVDIYMPDIKFWSSEASGDLCDAPDYPERARSCLKEMHRQVGDLVLDQRGVAQRGLLVRHLVMPNGLAGTSGVVDFIAKEISQRTYVNIMDQYHPCGGAFRKSGINRRITSEEFMDAQDAARRAGLVRLDDRHRHRVSIEL